MAEAKRVGTSDLWTLPVGFHVKDQNGRIDGPQVVRVLEFPGPMIAVLGIITGVGVGRVEIENVTEDQFPTVVKSST